MSDHLSETLKSRIRDHFTWSEDGISILGLTAIGRVTVKVLQMNNTYAMTVRSAWVSVGWHPPKD